tara:strand:+ start:39 stop:482 length:444 start_codon:yes stop_codon:yes gene_type:complete
MTNLLEYDADWKQKFWKNNPNWTIGEFLDMNSQMKSAKKRADEATAASQVEGADLAGNTQWGGGAFTPGEILSGVAGPNVTRNGVSMGDRQMGLNMLGNAGAFGTSFGVNPTLSTSGVAGFTDPDVTGFGGGTGVEIDWSGGPDEFM